jgi:predicted PurR-regulated permease PerM
MMKLSKHQRTALAWGGVALALILLLWLLSPVLAPFIAALVLAYALAPAVQALVNRRVPRSLAVLIVEVVFATALFALVLLVLPILSKELPALREQIPALAKLANDKVSPWLAQHGIYMQLDPASIKAFVLKYLDANFEEWLATALSSARIGGSFLLAFIGNAVLLPVVLFYLLDDWPGLVERIRALVPPAARDSVGSFLEECDETLGQYLRGQLLVMLVLAIRYDSQMVFEGALLMALFGFVGSAAMAKFLLRGEVIEP